MSRQNRTLLNLIILGIIFFGGALVIVLSGCAAHNSGGADYFYYFYDPATNATKCFAVNSVREIGPTKVKIVCENGDNITISTEGMKPGPSNLGAAQENLGKALDVIKAGMAAGV